MPSSSGQFSQRGWLDHLGALGLPERRQQSIVDVALHTRTKLLKGHFRPIGEPQTVVMWAALQASEGDVFICRYAERSCTTSGMPSSLSFVSYAMHTAVEGSPGAMKPMLKLGNLWVSYFSPSWAGRLR